MTTTPDTYAHRWQATAGRILGELLAEGERHQLPPLCWTLATTGALTGTAEGLTATPDEQRAAITAWAAHLGADVTEHVRANGRITLHAFLSRGGERIGALRAEIYPTDD